MGRTILDPRQHSLFKPESSWRPPATLPSIHGKPIIGLDTETCDPSIKELGPGWARREGFLVGTSLAWYGSDSGRSGNIDACYLPVAHDGGDNMDAERVTGWLKDLLAGFTGTLVLMNGMYDLGWLSTLGISVNPTAELWDVMWTETLLDEHRNSYSLKNIALARNLAPKDETLLTDAASAFGVDPKGGLWRLPARFVGPYAEHDARLPIQIYEQQVLQVEAQSLQKVHKLEHSLVPCLLDMRKRGVRVDVAKAEELRERFLREETELLSQVKRVSGVSVDAFSADSVAIAFEKVGLQYPRTPNGKPSFTDPWLSTQEHELPRLITQARKKNRAAKTFCEGMILNKQHNGRVHSEFHPLRSDDGGTVSGRFSSSSPNLQQVPARDPEMNTLIRGMFLPEDGELWAAIDYSQQEPRLTVHYAESRNCSKASYAAEQYRNNPDTDYHNLVAGMVFGPGFTKDDRKIAKNINLGLAYGMGGPKLCRSIGKPTKFIVNKKGNTIEVAGDEGQAILDQYNRELPYISELSRHYSEIATLEGCVRTLSGRLCRFPYWEPRTGGRALLYDDAVRQYGEGGIRRAFTHAALNRKIQGGSADMIKVAIRNLYRAGFTPLVTVHDENGLSVSSPEKAREAAEIMRSCVKLRVPLKVDVDIGPSWGTAKPMSEED